MDSTTPQLTRRQYYVSHPRSVLAYTLAHLEVLARESPVILANRD